MGVLTDPEVSSVEDELIAAIDNLNGFTNTINNVFHESKTQIYVVHQNRNAFRYVAWKDKRSMPKILNLSSTPRQNKKYRSHWKIFPENGTISIPMLTVAGRMTGRNLPCFLNFHWR